MVSSTLAGGEEEEANGAVHPGPKRAAAIDCAVRNGTLSRALDSTRADGRVDKTLS